MDPVMIPLLFIGVVAIAAIVFVVWVALKLMLFALYVLLLPIRWLSGGHRRSSGRSSNRPQPQVTRQGIRCPFGNCLALNPPNARFCGRCGSSLAGRYDDQRLGDPYRREHYHYRARSRTRVSHVA